MKVKFFGAAHSVTGSCYAVTTEKSSFSVDCGMHQGNSITEKRNYDIARQLLTGLDFILLTHAHIDHSGLLPRVVKEGFKGPIYCTEPTKALLDVMLLDSAHIQEMDAEWESRKLARRHKPPVEPLYTEEDVRKTMELLVPVTYERIYEHPNSGVRFVFRDAGHILGSAIIEVEATEADHITRLLFSGDLGRRGALMMNDPKKPRWKPDVAFVESTYGDRNHKSSESSLDEMAEAINYSYKLGEKTIIPAFAIERTQEILLILKDLLLAKKIPSDIPIFVDSPLAIRATKIYRSYLDYMDRETSSRLLDGEDPFDLPNLTYTLDPKDSQKLNTLGGAAIIISASGMCNAGRIRHHLRHNLWRSGASIVFTGYQAVGTPGRQIVDGAKSITLLGEELSVAARIFTIGGFSAHAGQDQLVEWVKDFSYEGLKVYLMHGEDVAITAFSSRLTKETGVIALAPNYLEEITLADGLTHVIERQTPPKQEFNWSDILYSTKVGLEQLEGQLDIITAKDEAVQLEIFDKITDIKRRIKLILNTT